MISLLIAVVAVPVVLLGMVFFIGGALEKFITEDGDEVEFCKWCSAPLDSGHFCPECGKPK